MSEKGRKRKKEAGEGKGKVEEGREMKGKRKKKRKGRGREGERQGGRESKVGEGDASRSLYYTVLINLPLYILAESPSF